MVIKCLNENKAICSNRESDLGKYVQSDGQKTLSDLTECQDINNSNCLQGWERGQGETGVGGRIEAREDFCHVFYYSA